MSSSYPPPPAGPPSSQPPRLDKPPSSPPGPPGNPYQQGGAATLEAHGTRGIPLGRLVKVELRKSVDTLASFWLVMGLAILIVMVEGVLLVVALVNEAEVAPGDFALPAGYALAFALPILAIMLVTTEWSQRTAMVTFTIEPRRGRVMAAKYLTCVVLTLATVVVGIVVGLVCALVCQLVQPDATTWDLRPGLVAGLFVTQLLAMTLGFALASLLLNTPAAIVLFFVYRGLPLLVFAILSEVSGTFEDIRPWIDFEGSQGPIYAWSLSTGEEWAHLLTSGLLWLGVPLVLGLTRIFRAEVK